MRRVLVALAIILALVACGEGKSKPLHKCHFGDTRSTHGHTEKCGPDGKWHL